MRAAIRRNFVADAAGGQSSFAHAVDLKGAMMLEDEPESSALWLPLWETADRTDSIYRRTAKRIGAPKAHLAQEIARLLGPDAPVALDWLRKAPLDLGYAASGVDPDGRATDGGGDAALSGLLAYTAWYAVHVAGLR